MTHSARLISVTPDAEKNIVYMARVSNPSNQSNEETAPRLLRYLIKHRHWSPFEMASMAVEIQTTRAIETQILRHRSFSFQSFSQRYSSVDELPPIATPMLRSQDAKNKQASHDDIPEEVLEPLNDLIDEHFRQAITLYRHLLASGVAKECAREVLPLATPTRLYMHGTIRSWIHYLQIRSGVETQLEHRMVAQSILGIFKETFPVIAEAAFSLPE